MRLTYSMKWAASGVLVVALTASVASASETEPANTADETATDSQTQPAPVQALSSYEGKSAIMAQPMNGKSVSDFEASMKQVEEQASTAEYRKLKNAIGYHLTYDFEVKRNKEKLYRKLDGQTPNQIISGVDTR